MPCRSLFGLLRCPLRPTSPSADIKCRHQFSVNLVYTTVTTTINISIHVHIWKAPHHHRLSLDRCYLLVLSRHWSAGWVPPPLVPPPPPLSRPSSTLKLTLLTTYPIPLKPKRPIESNNERTNDLPPLSDHLATTTAVNAAYRIQVNYH